MQGPAAPQIIDKGQPTAGLVAHMLVSRFVDHLPYCRQEATNAGSGVHTPRSTLAASSGAGGTGTLICDDYKGYETLFKLSQRVEAGGAPFTADARSTS